MYFTMVQKKTRTPFPAARSVVIKALQVLGMVLEMSDFEETCGVKYGALLAVGAGHDVQLVGRNLNIALSGFADTVLLQVGH